VYITIHLARVTLVNECSVQVPPVHAQCAGGEQGGLRLLLRLQAPRHVPDRRRHHPAPRRRRHPLLHLRRAGALQQRHETRRQGRSRPPLPDRTPPRTRHLLIGCLVGWRRCVPSGPQLGSCSHVRILGEKTVQTIYYFIQYVKKKMFFFALVRRDGVRNAKKIMILLLRNLAMGIHSIP
jgi:hypothetical protein